MVLRFGNNELINELEDVLERITFLLSMDTLSPGPSPTSGRGERSV